MSPIPKPLKIFVASLQAMIMFLCLYLPAAARAEVYDATCGTTHFQVSTKNFGHPLDNRYELYGGLNPSSGMKKLYASSDGGWFYAACVKGRHDKDILLFQTSCGGSTCVEDRYGMVEAKALKIILLPERRNVGNAKKASEILGRPVPYLPKYQTVFCCSPYGLDH